MAGRKIALDLLAIALARRAFRAVRAEPDVGPLQPEEKAGAAALVGESRTHRRVPAHLCGREAEDGGGGGEGVAADLGSGWHGDASEGAAVEGAPID